MNTDPSDQILLSRLGMKNLDYTVCMHQLKAFRCCVAIRGAENCSQFLDYYEICYQNLGRKLNSH